MQNIIKQHFTKKTLSKYFYAVCKKRLNLLICCKCR